MNDAMEKVSYVWNNINIDKNVFFATVDWFRIKRCIMQVAKQNVFLKNWILKICYSIFFYSCNLKIMLQHAYRIRNYNDVQNKVLQIPKNWIYSRAIIPMATKEHGLSSVITETIVFEARNISTLRIVIFHTAFKILVQKEKEGKSVWKSFR